MISAGPRGRILERTRVGGDGGEQAIGDSLGDRPAGDFEQAKNQFAAGRLPGRDPIEIGVTGVAFVVVDVDETVPPGNTGPHLAQSLETGGVGRNDAVELQPRLGLLNDMIRVEEFIFLRDGVLVPAHHLLALVLERQAQAQLRTDAIAIGTDVADDAEGFAFSNLIDNSIHDGKARFHFRHGYSVVLGLDFSSSSIICRTRLPRTTESSMINFRVGVYFRTTARPTSPWMRLRWRVSRSRPRFCWSAVPRMLMKTAAECRSPSTSTSLTVTRPASLTVNSRRITSPIWRFKSSRTRWSRREGIEMRFHVG